MPDIFVLDKADIADIGLLTRREHFWRHPMRLDSETDSLIQSLETVITALPNRTAESMARAAYRVLCKAAVEHGQDPDIEVFIKKPGEPRHFEDTTCWCVAWEAGPWEWAIPASLAITETVRKVVEPYCSFDLCFYPSEDR